MPKQTAGEGRQGASTIGAEFEDAKLGDQRRTARLVKLAKAFGESPSASIPDAMASHADEDAAYRFLSNEAITASAVLQPHIQQTVGRAAAATSIVVAHDTTDFDFGGAAKRVGMGRLRGEKGQGFFAHVSLAISADATRRPLGLLALCTHARVGKKRSNKTKAGHNRSGADYAKRTNKESARWLTQVQSAEQQFGSPGVLVHVMDREADAFPLLASMVENETRFVVRLARDRVARVEPEQESFKVRALVAQAEDGFALEVPVAARSEKRAPRANKVSGARVARVAQVGFRAMRVELRRPHYVTEGPPWLQVNVVEVHELNPPSDADRIDWILLTTEPIETPADIYSVVQHYRARWLIEEFFKALKTGCAIEKRQLETYDAMVNLLAILAPIAWQMLALRDWARSSPDSPATVVLTPTRLKVLRACGRMKLSDAPTVREALFAIAALGGHHIKRDPGWIVLGRGMEKLVALESGWMAHQLAVQEM